MEDEPTLHFTFKISSVIETYIYRIPSKACLQHPRYRQINYEAPSLLKKAKPLVSQLNEPLSLSLRLPSQPHDHASSLIVFSSSRKHYNSIICRPSSIYALAYFSSITLAPFLCRNGQNCPLPPSRKQMSNIVLRTSLDRRKKEKKEKEYAI